MDKNQRECLEVIKNNASIEGTGILFMSLTEDKKACTVIHNLSIFDIATLVANMLMGTVKGEGNEIEKVLSIIKTMTLMTEEKEYVIAAHAGDDKKLH